MSLIDDHLRFQLGAWPSDGPITVAGSVQRTVPGWDGRVRPVAMMSTPIGVVLSVPPAKVAAAQELVAHRDFPAYQPQLAELVGLAGRVLSEGAVYRYTEKPADVDDLGEWVEPADHRVPAWLKPFNGGVLCAWDERGAYLAGVGIKHHDQFAEEIAVGTEERARGKGLARRLVATAAREILHRGRVPTYVHEVSNLASDHVADAAGFPDRGWRLRGMGSPAR